ncbi:MAG: MFS transporter, partial [Actinobacteria bacterium]|nr:MFS transporter [Actinomycetota bacterium]
EPAMRGRVMALYALVFIGSTPVGGPLIGWVSEELGPRFGLALGGVASVVAAVTGIVVFRNTGADGDGDEPAVAVDPAVAAAA